LLSNQIKSDTLTAEILSKGEIGQKKIEKFRNEVTFLRVVIARINKEKKMYGDCHPHLSFIHLKNSSNYPHFRVYDKVLGFNTWRTCTFVMDSVNNILKYTFSNPTW
jgi:hypothetical protein